MLSARASRATSRCWPPLPIEIGPLFAAGLGVTYITFDMARFGRYFGASDAIRPIRMRMRKSNGGSPDAHRPPEWRPPKHLRSTAPLLIALQLLIAAVPGVWSTRV